MFHKRYFSFLLKMSTFRKFVTRKVNNAFESIKHEQNTLRFIFLN